MLRRRSVPSNVTVMGVSLDSGPAEQMKRAQDRKISLPASFLTGLTQSIKAVRLACANFGDGGSIKVYTCTENSIIELNLYDCTWFNRSNGIDKRSDGSILPAAVYIIKRTAFLRSLKPITLIRNMYFALECLFFK